jgi:calcineurin-like phosphoesterase family protein
MMKRNTEKIFLMAVLTLVLTVFIGNAVAQDKPADNMQLVIEKVKADKKLLVAQNMQLTEAEAKAFWPIYEKYQEELFLIRGRTIMLISNYADAYDTMDNKTAKKLLNDFVAIETLRLKLIKAYIPKFQKVLSDVKAARYIQIENKINAGIYFELAARIPLMQVK